MAQLTCGQKTFDVIKLLGKGKGGYSWLVSDSSRQYVLKQIHHEPCSYYQFGNKMETEIHDYHRLWEIGIRMPELIDTDMEKEVLLKEYIEGPTIYEMLLTEEDCAVYQRQLEEMCVRIYAAHTNIDYFPTNFVVQDGLIYYTVSGQGDTRSENTGF